MTLSARAAGVVDAVRGRQGDPEVLGVRGFARLEGGDAGVQQQGRHADSLGHQAGEDLGGEGTTGARHFGGARFGGVHVLIGADRVAALYVAVANGPAVTGQEAVQALGRLDAGDPEPDADATGAGGVRRQEGHLAPAGQPNAVTRRRVEGGLPVAPDLHGPQPGRQLCREVHLPGRPVGCGAVYFGGQGARGVDHHQIALVEEAGDLGEGGVHQRAVGPGRHQHADGIARHAAVFGGRGRFELGRQGEGQRVELGQPGRRRVLQARHGQRAHARAPVERSSATR